MQAIVPRAAHGVVDEDDLVDAVKTIPPAIQVFVTVDREGHVRLSLMRDRRDHSDQRTQTQHDSKFLQHCFTSSQMNKVSCYYALTQLLVSTPF